MISEERLKELIKQEAIIYRITEDTELVRNNNKVVDKNDSLCD